MANVTYQGVRPSAPPADTVIKTDTVAGAEYQYVKIDLGGAGATIPMTADGATRSVVTIDYEHHEIHGGSFFRAGFQKDITGGGTAIFAITTPNTTKWLHFRPAVDVELEALIMLYENPTSVTGGNAVTPRNADRNSATASGATVVTDPTIDTTGAVVLGNVVEGSGKSTGGNSESAFEWILKQNETYVLVVTNRIANAANECNIRCQWYEHTNL